MIVEPIRVTHAQVPQLDRLRVLICDDEPDAVLTLSTLMEIDGHEVRGAHDGLAALDVARDFEPHIVLLDIRLPTLSGYDVARELRARYGRAPLIIAVTACVRDMDRMRAEFAGFDYHLPKPYRPEVLRALVQARARRIELSS